MAAQHCVASMQCTHRYGKNSLPRFTRLCYCAAVSILHLCVHENSKAVTSGAVSSCTAVSPAAVACQLLLIGTTDTAAQAENSCATSNFTGGCCCCELAASAADGTHPGGGVKPLAKLLL
jgi:hypothetical protein